MRTILTACVLAVSALALVGCAPGATAAWSGHEVVYTITSDGSSATSISYVSVTGADISLAQADDASVPWTKTVKIPDGAFSTSILSLSGQLGGAGTTITCDISVDGASVVRQTSTGQFAAVTCNGSE